MRIAFIGLGVMGAPMAANLIAAGHQLTLSRVKSERHAGLLAAGGVAAENAAAAVKDAEIVITMLPDTADVEHVLFGPDGVVEALQPRTLVIDMSSISPTATRGFASRVSGFGGRYVDAPVSGGEVGAKAGTLSIMAGGSEEDFATAKPVLEVMGANVSHIGEVGAGQTTKVANQIIVALTIEAVAEAFTLTEASGVDLAKVRTALLGGFASSKILELHGERMIQRAFDPGFRLRLHRKDLNIALTAAADLNVALPNTAVTHQLMNAAVAAGDADADHSAMISTVRRLRGDRS